MSGRFSRPDAGPAVPVRFPAISRQRLDNGLRIWTIPFGAVPVVSATLVISRGTADDPAPLPGLASLTGDLLDEGAGDFDAIGLAEVFARIGTHLDIDVGPDATSVSCSGLARSLDRTLDLMAMVVRHPRFQPADFERVRELRVNRLRQLSRSSGAAADRAFVAALFQDHAYGHGSLGSTATLMATTADDARAFWRRHIGPSVATLVVVGQVDPADVATAARLAFDTWDAAVEPSLVAQPAGLPDPRVLLVDRPGAAQSELRIGHTAPGRMTPDYHGLVVLNAVLGGQFTSRINRRLREEKGITYGAHTSFDFRRVAGSFSCDTSVQTDATAAAIADVLAEFTRVRDITVPEAELAAARASLTRGYVRSFETAGQVARAAAQLVVHGLPDDTFDAFVPVVENVDADAVLHAARRWVRPDDATTVVVGDASACAPLLESIGRTVAVVVPEF